MVTLAQWLPIVGALLTLLIGLIGFFKPRLILDPMGVKLETPAAVSEARAVFGGMNLGTSVAALVMNEPIVFTLLGIAWSTLLLARFWSLAVDGIGVKGAIPGIVVDAVLAFLFLSPLLLG